MPSTQVTLDILHNFEGVIKMNKLKLSKDYTQYINWFNQQNYRKETFKTG